jgi:hypothetical protein
MGSNAGDTIGVICGVSFFVVVGAVILAGWSVAARRIFRLVRAGRSVEVRPGEVVACHRKGSTTIERLYLTPGRHARPKIQGIEPQRGWDLVWLRFWIRQPVLLDSSPVQIMTSDGKPVLLTVRLAMAVADPARPEPYVVAVVSEDLKRWQEEVLPALIAPVAAAYALEEVLNSRARVANGVAAAVAPWFADRPNPRFGLVLESAAVLQATIRPSRGSE